jgi:hypothetical protein
VARIGPATPEGDILAEFLFEFVRFHITGGNLYRVNDIVSGYNQVGQEFVDGATRINYSPQQLPMHGRRTAL